MTDRVNHGVKDVATLRVMPIRKLKGEAVGCDFTMLVNSDVKLDD